MAGADKLMEPVAGEPILARVVRRACATGLPVYVTLPPDRPDRAAAIAGQRVRTIVVPDAASGMAASFRAAARSCPGDRGIMTLFADMPEIGTGDLLAVAQAFEVEGGERVVRAASATGEPGQPVVFPARLVPAFAALRGDTGGREILRGEDVLLVRLPGDRATTDLDTPEDWAAWRARTGL